MKNTIFRSWLPAALLCLAGCAGVAPQPAEKVPDPQLIEESTFHPPVHKNVKFTKAPDGYRIELGETGSTFGKWRLLYELPERLTGCRFRVEHDAPALADANLLPVRVTWLDAEKKDLRSSYLERESDTGFSRLLRRPEGARYVVVDCGLRYAPGKSVTFRRAECRAAEVPRRPVRLVVVKATPKDDKLATCEDNQQRMALVLEKMLDKGEKPDLIVFPETFLTRWVPDLGESKGAQTIPGPHTDFLGSYARKLNSNIVVSMREKEGDRYFASVAVIDRTGKVVGRYRKTQFTIGEYENGYDWGKELPVFDLDFGRIGVLVCWDLWFPEAARVLRLKGAEIIAYPIASTSSLYFNSIWPARAVENGVYLAAAISGRGGQCPSRIVGPDGKTLAETWRSQTYAATTIDLSEPLFIPWLSVSEGTGENGNFYMGERQPSLFGDLGRSPVVPR